MNRWKKYYLFIISLWLTSIFPSLLISVEPIAATEIVNEDSQESVSLDAKFEHFIDFVRGLQREGLFDGEILVARHDQILLNLQSEDISVAKGGGSIISTATDLLKWNQSLHQEKSILPEELYQLFITDNMDKYGYGIGVENIDGKTVYDHGGGIGTYQTLLLYMPEDEVSIILLSNIAYDFDKVEDEYKTLLVTLRETFSDEKEREMEAQKVIQEKYPNTRGFEMIGKNTGKLFE
jgi:hypothetical protein